MPKVLGMAYALPERRVDNAELSQMLEVATDELDRSVGVTSRRYAASGEGPSDLAMRAATGAVAEAGWDASAIEFLVFATMTPDVTFPGSGCYLQHKLKCGTIGALDIRAQCAGLLFGLDVADQFLRAGRYRTILLATGEVHSSGLDLSPAGAAVTPLFGDGAAVLALDADGDGIVATVVRTDASQYDRFWCEFPASRRTPTRFVASDLNERRHFPQIDAGYVRKSGREKLTSVVDEVLARGRLSRDEIRRFFFQHVFRDVAQESAAELGIVDRTSVGESDVAHVASASLAISLCRARERGEVGSGDLVCLATAGAGENWGAVILRL